MKYDCHNCFSLKYAITTEIITWVHVKTTLESNLESGCNQDKGARLLPAWTKIWSSLSWITYIYIYTLSRCLVPGERC